MSAEADNVMSQTEAGKINEQTATRTEGRRKKRIRERGSQTDDESEQHDHGCKMCNTKLTDIQDKLNKMLSLLPEIQTLKKRVTELEKEKEELKSSLELTQAEVEKVKSETSVVAAKLTTTSENINKVDELERRVIKQECFNRRNNIKFFGINDRESESPESTHY